MLHQFADSIQGSLAEQGVAKYLNTYFASHVNTFTMPDLMWEGKKIQVRCQNPKEKNYLILRKNAKDEEIYILAINECPIIKIKGWVIAKDIIHSDKYLTDFGLKDRPKVFGVPTNDLHPINEIFYKR